MKSKSNITLEDFVAYLPMHNYFYLPTREPWPASSVDSQFPFQVALLDANGKPLANKKDKTKTISASSWLDQNRPVQQMTWAPGLSMLIRDQLVGDGGWFAKPGATVLNLYRPALVVFGKGSKTKIKPWLDHLYKIYPDDADHIIKWLAQRVQRPQEKINHALMLGGAQGIGKDTLLAPLKYAIGAWNFRDITPKPMLGRFNGFVKSVILRISEVRDLGETNRFVFYDHLKTYTAAPPEVLHCDEKNLREHAVLNVCGVIITTNYKTGGIYLPADDRRTYVAWSDCEKEKFSKKYWRALWKWYAKGGNQHVADYLAEVDISRFDAKAPPPKTAAFWAIVDANRAPEEGELADIVEKLENPDALTLFDVIKNASFEFGKWLEDRKNRRVIPHRFESVGYVPVRNNFWRINGARQVVYAKSSLSPRDQFKAIAALQRSGEMVAKEKAEKTKQNGGVHAPER